MPFGILPAISTLSGTAGRLGGGSSVGGSDGGSEDLVVGGSEGGLVDSPWVGGIGDDGVEEVGPSPGFLLAVSDIELTTRCPKGMPTTSAVQVMSTKHARNSVPR